MLAYTCENCKKIMFGGYENEYYEWFCSIKCYKKYCKKNNYKPDVNILTKIKTALD